MDISIANKPVVYLVWYQDSSGSAPHLWGLFEKQVDAIDRAKELLTKTSGVENPRELYLSEKTNELFRIRKNSQVICTFCERGYIFIVEKNTVE
jgi:hypothetical protein